MANVLACVDGSSYDTSVCDHAAWLASRMDAQVEILHVASGSRALSAHVAQLATERLEEIGVAARGSQICEGDFCEVATELRSDMYVIGKRGTDSEQDRRQLGSNVERLIRATPSPVCLASQVFLPIGKALVLLDADLDHRDAVEFVAGHPGLRQLDLDLVVVDAPGQDPGPKVEWAKRQLESRAAATFTIAADGLTDGLVQHMETGRADLFVISRAVLLPAPEARLQRIEEGGLWAWRTPVLVC